MEYETPLPPKQENRELSPEAVAKQELIGAIQNILNTVRASIESGYHIAWISLEISFKNKTLRTRSDQEAESSKWGQVISEVASTLGVPEHHIIDPYGSGNGGTVSFQFGQQADKELYKTGFNGKPTGQFKGLKQSLSSISVDVDGVGTFRGTRE